MAAVEVRKRVGAAEVAAPGLLERRRRRRNERLERWQTRSLSKIWVLEDS